MYARDERISLHYTITRAYRPPGAGKSSGATPTQVADMVSLIEATAHESGLEVLLWRRVPIGEKYAQTRGVNVTMGEGSGSQSGSGHYRW